MAGWKRWVTHWREQVSFGAQHRRRFELRIALRLARLRWLLWLRRSKSEQLRRHWPKPVALLTVGIVIPFAFALILSALFPAEARGVAAAFRRLLTDPEAPALEWREASQILLLLIGIPTAFLLWLFRDINVNATLDNQRKDVNLKEFQEIQMRAAGAMDEKYSEAARETLQIAALHQMRAFLRGEYGKSFQRPAFELLRARLVASAEITGTRAVGNWLSQWRADHRILKGRDAVRSAVLMNSQLNGARRKLNHCAVASAERTILSEEWQAILRGNMPLAGSTLDRVTLGRDTLLSDIDFNDCSFLMATLRYVHLERAQLGGAHFEGAYLRGARLEGAVLDYAFLEKASFIGACLDRASLDEVHATGAQFTRASMRHISMTGADLTRASFLRADLRGADLEGATVHATSLRHARLEGAKLIDVDVGSAVDVSMATFDHHTEFADDWAVLTEAERDEARQPWIAKGAILTK